MYNLLNSSSYRLRRIDQDLVGSANYLGTAFLSLRVYSWAEDNATWTDWCWCIEASSCQWVNPTFSCILSLQTSSSWHRFWNCSRGRRCTGFLAGSSSHVQSGQFFGSGCHLQLLASSSRICWVVLQQRCKKCKKDKVFCIPKNTAAQLITF